MPFRSHNGAVVVWKPRGFTSREALEEVETRLRIRPLGHTGSLDPLASGILLLLGGEARKFQHLFTAYPKVYDARIALGLASHSEDGEGPLWCPVPRVPLPSRGAVETALETFLGEQDQIPPLLSAIRIRGQRSYNRVRQGEPVPPTPRRVTIHSLELRSYAPPIVEVRVKCSAGTYVRSLARDLGQRLGTAAFLTGLRRVQLGPFPESIAIPVESVRRSDWFTLEDLLRHEPAVQVTDENALRLSHGQRIPAAGECPVQGRAIAWCDGRVLGLVDTRGGSVYPRRWVNRGSV